MTAIKSLSKRVVGVFSRKPDQHHRESAGAAKPVRRAGRVRYLTAVIACVTVLAVYSQLLGRDPVPPGNLPNVPPDIEDFTADQGVVLWTFEGRVLDEHPVGLVITFSGLLKGHRTTVSDPEGYFWYSVQLQGTGTATAHTVDDQGLGSNYADCAIF